MTHHLRSIAVLSASLTALLGQPAEIPAYHWSATGPLQVAREGACAAALPDGRILVAGGTGATGALRSVEIYQQDGRFLPAADMLRARAGHTCTTLSDGRVLAAGGQGDGPSLTAEWFDPALNTWTPVEKGAERWNHTATLLPDGQVLLAGGETSEGTTDVLEWFNPASNRIRPLPGSLSAARTLHASALLRDGSVLVAGGWDGQALLGAVDLVMPDGSVRNTALLPGARAGHTATALDNGCVLIAGGLGVDGDLQSAFLYCADSGEFRPAGNMAAPRSGHLAFLLPNNGKVLITGGFSLGEPTASSELFDPQAGVFLPAGSLTKARLGIAGAADPTSGAVLAVGGYTDEGPLAGCGILRGPTVAFDRVRYLDGDAVTVSGLGWKAGEKVDLQVATQPFPRAGTLSQIAIQKFQPVASALGRIQQTLFVAAASTAGATYTVTATGAASGLTAANSARQVSRTNVTLNVSPFPALTRQPMLLQAIVQPAAALDPLDGKVDFQAGATALGSVSSTGQTTLVSRTGQITDGTSNTIQLGESAGLSPSSTGFSRTFTAADGSVRSVNGGGAFQLVTRDLPAGTNVLTAGAAGSATASYSAFTSLYAPNSATTTVSVQKRSVNITISPLLTAAPANVGNPVNIAVSLSPTQLPLADVSPTGNAHLTLGPGNVVDVPLSPQVFTSSARALFSVLLPAGTHSLSAQYDGDGVYQAGSSAGGTAVTVGKGSAGFSLSAGKPTYTVGEPITLSARITHPKVVGATPTGQITRTGGPSQFQGATVGADPGNTGTIDTNLPVTGFPAPGNFVVTMAYSGDANFQSASAGAILLVTKAVPQITLIPPAQVIAGQEAVFVVRAGAPSNLTFRPAVSGQVTLTGVPNGATANLVPNTGSSVGTLRQTFPTAGTFTIGVQYGGDGNFQAATSATVQVVVQ